MCKTRIHLGYGWKERNSSDFSYEKEHFSGVCANRENKQALLTKETN